MTDELDDLKKRLDQAEKGQNPDTHDTHIEGPSGKALGDATQLAIDLVLAVGISLAIGIFLDKKLGTTPWFLLIFLIFGVAAGFRNFYVFARKLMRPNQDPNKDTTP